MRYSKSFPIVISGPSGAGKTTLVSELLPRVEGLAESISVTTRPPRKGESEGSDYFFVSDDEFERMKGGKLVEWAEVHGFLYGTPKKFLEEQREQGNDVLLNIDVQGGLKVRKAFPETVMIFILPPSFKVLRERMMNRGGEDESDMELRLENAKREMEYATRYRYLVINDELDKAVEEIRCIICAERVRRSRSLGTFLRDFFR